MLKTYPSRWAWIGALLWLFGLQPAAACTLWGAVGSAVDGGGTLVAKNRDWVPDHRQELSLLKPAQGYQALVLRAVGGAEPGIKAGVNEKGLVIVSATASQIDASQRKAVPQEKELMSHLLATCASVDELLKKIDRRRRPVFYLAGDRTEIVLIEVAPEGRRSIRRQGSGTLHHTNHYCALDGQDLKRKPDASSRQRYARMGVLLQDPPAPFTIEDFIRFSEDAVAGPDASIW
jgi:isopenicillin-N N-acyltransferase like protein